MSSPYFNRLAGEGSGEVIGDVRGEVWNRLESGEAVAYISSAFCDRENT